MRRALAIFLTLAFGLGPFAAFLNADDDARLPVCCRRHGVHHCTMPGSPATDASGSAPTIGAPAHCPLYPGSVGATTSPHHALAFARIHVEASDSGRLPLVARETAPHTNQIRARAVRGPPAAYND